MQALCSGSVAQSSDSEYEFEIKTFLLTETCFVPERCLDTCFGFASGDYIKQLSHKSVIAGSLWLQVSHWQFGLISSIILDFNQKCSQIVGKKKKILKFYMASFAKTHKCTTQQVWMPC